MASKFEEGHNECRRRVCVSCYRKGDRTISPNEVKCIDENLIEGYRVDHPDFPCALCTGCHLELSKKINDNAYNLVPKVNDYNPERSKYLRSGSSVCECRICNIAKMTGLAYHRMIKRKRGRRPSSSNTPTIYKICTNCFQKIYQGSNHSVSNCRYSRRNKVSNVEELVSSPTTLQRVASRVIKNQDGTPLSTLGPNRKLINESAGSSHPSFSGEQLFGIQTDLGLSNKKTRVLAQDLRLATDSRKAVESGFKESIVKHSHSLDDYFKMVKISYTRIDKDTKVTEHFEQCTVVCNDLPKFIDLVLQKRSLEDCESLLIKVGIDGGGGFLKICLGVFDMDNLVSDLKVGMSKKFKDSGVKKVFLIATVPDVSENYVNVRSCG